MKSLLRIAWRIVLYGAIFFFVSTFLAALYYKYKPVEYTPLMFIRSMEHTSDGERPRIKHEWVPLEEMSPQLPIAVIASEDQKFMQHNGFDVEAIEQARAEAEAGKRVRGASTISQQTAKNVFLWPSSTWVRKGFEVYFTFLVETLWSKERIMEVYLNSIEMGDGIYGAQAVANEHFGYDASKLTSADCALIAATLPNPREYSSKNPSKYMRKRQRWILKQMKTVKFSCENDEE